jgi:hypothetical protein
VPCQATFALKSWDCPCRAAPFRAESRRALRLLRPPAPWPPPRLHRSLLSTCQVSEDFRIRRPLRHPDSRGQIKLIALRAATGRSPCSHCAVPVATPRMQNVTNTRTVSQASGTSSSRGLDVREMRSNTPLA